MGQESEIGVGLLFGETGQSAAPQTAAAQASAKSSAKARSRPVIPNPYAASSSDSDEEVEADLDEVHTVRRSLARPTAPAQRAPVSDQPKRGWKAHQSVFPASSSSSSSQDSGGEKETEPDTETEDERSRMMGMGRSRQKSRARTRSAADREADEDPEGYILSPSELYEASSRAPPANDLEEPLLGPDDIARRGGVASIPVRLQVYHGRFGHWEREGLRKYKGGLSFGE